ncbi:MAG: LPS assembly protein LptD, partial [Gammaproteobacteria bacterium]|nr:LPS assembly protein LptD [Gammaproteobacteria bacterium]
DDDLYNQDRNLVSYLNTWNPGNHWGGSLLYNEVSDKDYFTDLTASLSSASTTHLDRKAEINYSTNNWTASGLLETFQTVDSNIAANARPYKRLPRLAFNGVLPEQTIGLDYMLDAEYVYFDHDVNTRGHRLNLNPGISLPFETLGWFVKPAVHINHTSYELDNQTAGLNDSPSRTLPVFSLDSGLFLERDTQIAGTDYLQTLEPRLFYLNVPYKNQTALPVFDTSTYDFSVSQLFSENRFSGIDRVGDANQLTAALTSRLLDSQTGREVVSATLGQIYYFRDRNITLPGGIAETTSDSDIVAALSLRPTEALHINGELQWDNDTTKTDKGAFGIRYNLDNKYIFNVSHRFQRDSLEQTDLAFYWALTHQWHAIGRWNYSVKDDQDLEYMAGLEYQSCCWALQLVSRNYLNGVGGTDNAVIMLQLTLKGLTSLGHDIDTLLEEGILGYQRH